MNETRCTLLPQRGVVALGGDDRVKFLQGLVSNDVLRAATGQAVYAALLTPQGKFLHDMFITADDTTLWLDVEAARAADLIGRLTKYKLRSAVTLDNMTGSHGVVVSATQPDFGLAYPDPRLPGLGWRAIAPRTALPAPDDAAAVAYDRLRLSLGVADGSRDMVVGDSLLLEGNFDRLSGVDFTKGCYMGQELTARTHYRTLIKKRLLPVTASAGVCPPSGTLLYAGGKEIGVMRSAQGDIGIALLLIDMAGQSVTTADGSVTLTAGQPVAPQG